MDQLQAIERAISSWGEFFTADNPRPPAEPFVPWAMTIVGQIQTSDGVAWIGDLTHAERPGVVRVEQDGRGGCNKYFTDGGEESGVLLKHLYQQASEYTASMVDPVDTFVSIIDEADYIIQSAIAGAH